MSDYRKPHLNHQNIRLAVGGDVLDAPSQTPIANLTLARQGNAVTKPSRRRFAYCRGKGDRVPLAEHLWIEVFG